MYSGTSRGCGLSFVGKILNFSNNKYYPKCAKFGQKWKIASISGSTDMRLAGIDGNTTAAHEIELHHHQKDFKLETTKQAKKHQIEPKL